MTKEQAIICLKGIKDYGRDIFTEQSDWQNSLDIAIKALEQQSTLLDKVKQAREEIEDRIDNYPDRNISEYEDCMAILDNLIAESEDK